MSPFPGRCETIDGHQIVHAHEESRGTGILFCERCGQAITVDQALLRTDNVRVHPDIAAPSDEASR